MPDSTQPTVFDVPREDVGRVSVVAVAGEIDLATADAVREAMRGAPALSIHPTRDASASLG